MNLQQLRYVNALVEEGTFVAAAARCNVTQPTLSNAIAQLEAELGNRLFNRTTRSVEPTPYGAQLLPYIQETLACFAKLRQLSKTLGDTADTTIQVGISPVVGLRRAQTLLSRFWAKAPKVKPIYREAQLNVLCELMQRGNLDILIAPFEAAPSFDMECSLLSLDKEPLVFVPSSADRKRWSNRESVTLSDIADQHFILLAENCGLTRVTKRIFEDQNLFLNRHAGEANSYTAIQEWADIGLGAAILPVSKLHKPDTFCVPIFRDGHPLTMEYFAVGKPSTISPELFARLWDSLLEVKLVLKHAIYPLAGARPSKSERAERTSLVASP